MSRLVRAVLLAVIAAAAPHRSFAAATATVRAAPQARVVAIGDIHGNFAIVLMGNHEAMIVRRFGDRVFLTDRGMFAGYFRTAARRRSLSRTAA